MQILTHKRRLVNQITFCSSLSCVPFFSNFSKTFIPYPIFLYIFLVYFSYIFIVSIRRDINHSSTFRKEVRLEPKIFLLLYINEDLTNLRIRIDLRPI